MLTRQPNTSHHNYHGRIVGIGSNDIDQQQKQQNERVNNNNNNNINNINNNSSAKGSSQTHTVVLKRPAGSTSWPFEIRGGIHDNALPVVYTHGIHLLAGNPLRKGDAIISVNGRVVAGATKDVVQDLLDSGGNSVTVEIIRNLQGLVI